MMSLSSFHLKGGGWYATDYAGKKAPGGEKKQEETPAAAPEKTETPAPKKAEE
jgi:predicted nucleic acid-binding Zn ribbon protein